MDFKDILKRFIRTSLIPFTFFTLLFSISSVYFWITTYQNYSTANYLDQQIDIASAMSALVTELQRERGASAGFSKGGFPLKKLEQQRKKTDQALKIYQIKSRQLPEKIKLNLKTQLMHLGTTRELINQKTIKPKEFITYYSKLIKTLLNYYIELSHIDLSNIPIQLKSIRILEEAKENSGKLRAMVTSVLSKNGPVSNEMLSTILKLKAGVDNNLRSYGVVTTKEIGKQIDKFYASKEWKHVLDTIMVILNKFKDGDFNQSAPKFFDIITISVDNIGKIVLGQRQELIKQIKQIKTKNRNILIIVTIALILLVVGGTLLLVKIFKEVREAMHEHSQQMEQEKRELTTSLHKVIEQLRENYEDMAESASKLKNTSQTLEQSSMTQSAATEEVVAAIEEISSMVNQTNKSSQEALDIANKAQQKTVAGFSVMEMLSYSMDDVYKANEELSIIIQLINEITEKTKIINNIVVKTELLSFNASIEAARAAEYGKGFAVVAEEIGNLARLSGESAKDIEGIIEKSVLKVSEVVNHIQSKTETGQKRTKECVEVFNSIKELNTNLMASVHSISAATNEQSKGVEQTTLAMNDISKGTQGNLKITQETSLLAKTVTEDMNTIKDSINTLENILQHYIE